jgi:hypothetical protein
MSLAKPDNLGWLIMFKFNYSTGTVHVRYTNVKFSAVSEPLRHSTIYNCTSVLKHYSVLLLHVKIKSVLTSTYALPTCHSGTYLEHFTKCATRRNAQLKVFSNR